MSNLHAHAHAHAADHQHANHGSLKSYIVGFILSIGVFTLLIIAIVVVGSLWVLHNMNVNMMHPVPTISSDSLG